MRIETDIGTFEIVECAHCRADGLLVIRGKTREALEALRDRYLPELDDIDDSSDEDLPFQWPGLRRGRSQSHGNDDQGPLHLPAQRDAGR